jgi:uncharacterized protein
MPTTLRRSLVLFFLLTFGITWLLQLPGVFAKEGLLPGALEAYMPFVMLGVLGPAAAAVIVTARETGRRGVRELFASLRRWRAPIECYLVAALLPGLLMTGILYLLRAAGREGPIAYFPDGGRLVMAVVIAFGEEIGWRGFALPRLQRLVGPFAASGLLGILWMFWHIPMFVGAGVPLSLLVVMSLLFTGGSLVYTWAYNRSGGALLVVVVAHFGIHLNNSHLALPGDVIPLVVQSIVCAGLGLVLMRHTLGGVRRASVGRALTAT